MFWSFQIRVKRATQNCTVWKRCLSTALTFLNTVSGFDKDHKTDFESVSKEILRQATFFTLDPILYQRYLADYVLNCLIPKPVFNFSECSDYVMHTSSIIFGIDVKKDIVPRFDGSISATYSGQAYSAKKFKGNRRPVVRLNGMDLKVDAANQGTYHPTSFCH